MKKRIISLLLVVSMVLSLLPVSALAAGTKDTAADSPFTDVKPGDWCYDAVLYAKANGFFSGTSETTFSPNGTMTRGMFVTVLGRMAGIDPAKYGGDTGFTDVPEGMYYAPYVKWAAQYGITGGTGDGRFSPDALITRQQMAALFVRYFEKFGIRLTGGTQYTTVPADLDAVAPYAREAVVKLWQAGLLNGNGTRFDPTGNASRAQAAALCQRTDKAVETWYTEPGVASKRVSVDPAAQTSGSGSSSSGSSSSGGSHSGGSSSGGSSSGGSSGGGTSTTTYYKVMFDWGNEVSHEGAVLPTDNTYAAGTAIRLLPTPTVPKGGVFLGWYYNAEMTNSVGAGDTLTHDVTLYADVTTGTVPISETPNYETVTVSAGEYSFGVTGASKADIKFIDITDANANVDFELSADGTVSAVLEAGETYQVELLNEKAQFTGKEASVRYLNIIVEKNEVQNASIRKDVKQKDASAVEGLDASVFEGLYKTDGVSTQGNETTGTFRSPTAYAVGETVAFTRGSADLTDVDSTKGDVAYVKITKIGDTTDGKTEYTYEMAEAEDVLFMPDTLPLSKKYLDTADGNTIAVSVDDMTKAMTDVDATALDVGDFIAFCDGAYSENATASAYGKITGVQKSEDGTQYLITYETYENENDYTAALDEALDVYYERAEDITLTPEEQSELQKHLIDDVKQSGYMEQAAQYMAAVLLESEDPSHIPTSEEIEARMQTISGTMLQADGASAKVDWTAAWVSMYSKLQNLGGNGFGVTVIVPFTVEMGNVSVEVTAQFKEEVLLKQSISTKRHKIGFLKYDYSLNASFEVGNYTGVNFKAVVHTENEKESDAALGKRLEQVVELLEQLSNGADTAAPGMEGLAATYQDLMENTSGTWSPIINQQLFRSSGSAFLHIFCWEVKGSFVVSANLNVAMGMDFQYKNHKRYNFSVRVKAKTSTNETIDLVPAQYSFDFYVVGTVALRAGIKLEMYVGLFSLKVDKIGITAEVGGYVQLWGYFYYHKTWQEKLGAASNSSGAMRIEIGIYIEIKFVAQAFSSSKLTYNPTLYAHQWPLWSAGQVDNIYAFANTDNTGYTFKTVKTLALPSSTYLMRAMDLRTGKLKDLNRDDAAESNFRIAFTNPVFSYNAATNTVTVAPVNGSLAESTDMTIVWKKAPLTFTSTPISKTIHLEWSDPAGMRYIAFDSKGGSAVAGLSGGSGAPLTWPADPERPGYTFDGWYTAEGKRYSSVSVMPTFPEGQTGVTLEAHWKPNLVNYTVEYYTEKLDGSYDMETETRQGNTDSTTNMTAQPKEGYTAKPIEQQTVAADGSTVVKVYYELNTYQVKFHDRFSDPFSETYEKTYRHGETITAPHVAKEGYTFAYWYSDYGTTHFVEGTAATENIDYYAEWDPITFTVDWIVDGKSIGTSTVQYGKAISNWQRPNDHPTKAEDKTGTYEFTGWNTKEDGTGIQYDYNMRVKVGMTFYAQFKRTPAKYTVTWDANGGDALVMADTTTNGQTDHGTVIVPPADPTKASTAAENYTFNGWNTKPDSTGTAWTEGATVTDNVTYYAQWTAGVQKYTVGWDANGGDALVMADTTTNGQTDYGTVIVPPADPTRAETAKATYDFLGWNTQTDGTGAALNTLTDNPDKVTADVTYYAQWRENIKSYKVMWDANGGNELSKTSEELPYGTAIVQPTTPTRDSTDTTAYTFTGWNTEKNGTGTAWTEGATVTDNVTYYAQWKAENRVYSITYYSEGGEHSNPNTYTYGTAVTLQDAKRTGYTFDGWYMAGETDAGTKVTEISAMQTGDVILTAHWTAKTYTVNLNANGGTGGTESITVTYGQPMPEITLPTRDSTKYQFDGFFDAVKGGTQYYNENGKSARTWDLTYDLDLYAHWMDIATKYDLYIAKPNTSEVVRVTGINADDVFGDGTVSFTYDEETGGLLTLNGYHYSGKPEIYNQEGNADKTTLNIDSFQVATPVIGWCDTGRRGEYPNVRYVSNKLTIKVIGDNSITSTRYGSSSQINCGIYAISKLTIVGEDSGDKLDVNMSVETGNAYGIYAFNTMTLELGKGTLDVSNLCMEKGSGIYASGTVTINSGIINVGVPQTSNAGYGYGIESNYINIYGGKVTVKGKTCALKAGVTPNPEDILPYLIIFGNGITEKYGWTEMNKNSTRVEYVMKDNENYQKFYCISSASTQSAEAELPAVFADEEPVDVVSVTEAPDALPAKDEAVLTTEEPSIA